MSEKELKAQISCIVRDMQSDTLEQCDKIADEIMGLLNTRPATPLVGVNEVKDIVRPIFDNFREIPYQESRMSLMLTTRHIDILTDDISKAILAKFGIPQKESEDLEKVLEEFDKEFPETIGNTNGIKGYPFIGRIDFKSFIMSHWPKPNPRFVEVGKKEASRE